VTNAPHLGTDIRKKMATKRHSTRFHVKQRLVVHNSVGNKTKSVRSRPRPVWDRSCHKIAVSVAKLGV